MAASLLPSAPLKTARRPDRFVVVVGASPGGPKAEIQSLKAALVEAKQAADDANLAKSRVLAVAGHDLRQPLQALSLLQGLLGETVEGDRAKALVSRLSDTVEAMSGAVDRLMDISPMETETATIKRPAFPIAMAQSATACGGVIFVVDDDCDVRSAIQNVLEDAGLASEIFGSAEDFLEAYHPGSEACLLIDAYLPGIDGLDLLHQLADAKQQLPTVMITGQGDIALAVEAMKAGAMEFIEKPVGRLDLLTAVTRALEQAKDQTRLRTRRADAISHIASLTHRQRQIMDLVLAGHPSKNIAADLGISQRTVENHRASIMKKTGVKSLPALARLAVGATEAAHNLGDSRA